jgi:hypothetical protein
MSTPPPKPVPKNYTVKVECLVPTTITYTVLALNEQDALKEVDKVAARKVSIQHNVNRKIKLKVGVYTLNSSMLKLSKIYRVM